MPESKDLPGLEVFIPGNAQTVGELREWGFYLGGDRLQLGSQYGPVVGRDDVVLRRGGSGGQVAIVPKWLYQYMKALGRRPTHERIEGEA